MFCTVQVYIVEAVIFTIEVEIEAVDNIDNDLYIIEAEIKAVDNTGYVLYIVEASFLHYRG